MLRDAAGLAVLSLTLAGAAYAGDSQPGVVSRVSVTSDKVADVSSLEAWKRSFIKPGMTDQEKALAIWRSSVSFRHQDPPPREFINNESAVYDPIQSFNVYGYGMCSCASAHVEALARYIGLDARGWGITGHSVPEIKINGHWSMLDSSLVNYFQKPDGSIAGVEEISHSIVDWRGANTAAPQDQDGLFHYMTNGGWRKGPTVLTYSTFYDNNGWLPAATHGWNSSMSEFGSPSKNFVYEYGSAIGYEVNIQLRPGEKLTRNWSNKGLHVNMDLGETPSALNKPSGTDNLRYTPAYGDLAPGRIGNGTIEWDVPLELSALGKVAFQSSNLRAAAGIHFPAVGVADPAQPGVLVLRMRSSYVLLDGLLGYASAVPPGGKLAVEYSENNGLDFKPVAIAPEGNTNNTVSLKSLILRRYDYLLRFTLTGANTELRDLKLHEDIQHSQRALPALDRGDNTITFAEGPQEGTLTINPGTNPSNKGKNLYYTDFHPTLVGMTEPNLRIAGGEGSVTFPIETPGDITRVRVGANYRARDAKDGFAVEASFDAGATWKSIGNLTGPTPGHSGYFVFSEVPSHSHAALVRFSGKQRNTTLLIDLRIDADYLEPHGASAPVRVTYNWEENGQPHQDVHVSRAAETYKIHCDSKPLMKSIILEQP